MDVAFILDKYFNSTKDVSIDVFDAQKTLRILFSHPKWILAGDSHLHGNRNERRDRSQSNRRSQD